LKGGRTCKLDFCEHCVIGKKTKVKFGTATALGEFWIMFTLMFGVRTYQNGIYWR